MNRPKLASLFIASAGMSLLILALATLMSTAADSWFVPPRDPILWLSMPKVFWIFGICEIVVAVVCLFGNAEGLKLWSVFGLTSAHLAYLFAMLCLVGPQSFDGYWSNLSSYFALRSDAVLWTLSAILLYLAAGSFALLQLLRTLKLSNRGELDCRDEGAGVWSVKR